VVVPPTTFTISGRATAASSHFADVDTADPLFTNGNNDTPATAQPLPSAATLGGWASASTDPWDYFHASLGAGQVVTLVPADPLADLELCVADAANLANEVCSTNPPGQNEQITIGAGGLEVIIGVNAITGASNYTLVLGQAPGSAQGSFVLGPRFVPGEVLVRFKDNSIAVAAAAGGPVDLATKAASLGLVPLGGGLQGRHALLGLPVDTAARAQALQAVGAKAALQKPDDYPSPEREARRETYALVTALRARADVASADLNYIFEPAMVPNDTYYGLQWHYPLIQLPQAWDITTGTPTTGSVVVAVIDTGVVLSHPDLAGQFVAGNGYDFVSSTAMSNDGDGIDPNPNDPGDSTGTSSSFHGTHVAGTIAALTNNNLGVAGIAPGARLMAVRVLGKGGGTSHDIIQGVRYAAGLSNDSGTVPAKRADVINLSLGCQDCFSATEQGEYTAALANGSIIVAAAGNNNSPLLFYPASYSGVVSVSAVDSLKAKAPYSNFNASVEVAAPGGDTSVDLDGNGFVDGVLSTLVQQDAVTPNYVFYQGTSMASPHMAGVVALMKAVCPALTSAQLHAFLSSGTITDQLGGAAKTNNFGYGLINALKAVQAAQAQCGATVATALKVDPTALDFGNATTSLVLTASKAGTGALKVTGVVDDAAWLTVTEASVDSATKLGTYTANVSRAGLKDGSYRATITFTDNSTPNARTVEVQVAMWVGANAPTTGDAGFIYLLFLDSSFKAVGQAQGRGTSGSYDFSFDGAAAGTYYLVAGTDQNNDGKICDPGEACGAYPTMGTPTPVVVTAANVSGLNFGLAFGTGAGILTVGPAAPWPEQAFQRLDRTRKQLGVVP
jgi:serine protease